MSSKGSGPFSNRSLEILIVLVNPTPVDVDILERELSASSCLDVALMIILQTGLEACIIIILLSTVTVIIIKQLHAAML